MDRFEELRQEYTRLEQYLCDCLHEDAAEPFGLFFLGAILHIWGSNDLLYAEDYAAALQAVTGQAYTMAQITTAMACCAERLPSVPDFFKKLADAHVPDSPKHCETFIIRLNALLVCASFINGDFTIEEARALSALIRSFTDHCAAQNIPVSVHAEDVTAKATALNTDSYVKKSTVPAPGSAPVKPDQPSPADPVPPAETPEEDEPEAETQAAERPQRREPADETLDDLLAELDELIGLDAVKQDVHSLMNFLKVSALRRARGMKVPVISYHLVFTGNPGTGKTTVARLIGKLYYRMGILPKGQLIETDRSTLVAGYVGQTAIKTQKVIQQALGGVLFIDEAYSLVGGEQDFGQEAIETILKAMEDHRDELIVIVAGYSDLMHEFIDSNPGLSSRFSKYFAFPDYNGAELYAIFESFCAKNGYRLDPSVSAPLSARYAQMYASRNEHFGNARTVRNLFEKAIANQADRLARQTDITDRDLELLTAEDVL